MSDKKLSEVETVKAKSNLLRGTLAESLQVQDTLGIPSSDGALMKFHGSYLQDDRDLRDERAQQKLEPAYSFMLRTRLPGGVATPLQWLALDEITQKLANGTLRLTTRQAFQLHGILRGDMKSVIGELQRVTLDSIAACGDVNRNVMCNPNPVDSRLHQEVHGWAVKLSEHLLPKSRAYFELFLGEEKVAGGEEEPLYGPTYLPRKFKVGIAVPPHNDIDVFTQDLGFIAIADGSGKLAGFNVTVGGGMGATHGDPATFPRLGDVIGFVTPEQILETAAGVLTVQRDFGDRTNRKHARLKYTIADRGLAWFTEELGKRLSFSIAPARAFSFEHSGDVFGWKEGHNGRWHLTLHVESGRIAGRALEGLREIARIHSGDFRLTSNQNLIIASVASDERARIDALVKQFGLDGYVKATPLKQRALACVALPTCGLAFAEAERYLPALTEKIETLLAKHALTETPISLRITGCPNGCARPYVAEIALVGKAPGKYALYLGGDLKGQRLNRIVKENVDEAGVLSTLDALFGAYAISRTPDEALGDFYVRSGLEAAA